MFQRFNISFWILQILVWLFYWLMVCVTLISVLPTEISFLELLQNKFVRALLGFLLTSVMRIIYKHFFKTHSFVATAWQAIICSVIFGLIWSCSLNFYYWLTSPNFNISVANAKLPQDVLNYSITLLAWSALYLGVIFWREWQTERENALQSAALAQKAQLEMLRYQLNPHFLFNALNSIRASVDEDSNRAKQMITQLSEFLRYSLLAESKKKIALSEELEAVRNYLAIEKIRFEDKLAVEFDIEKAAEDFQIPNFLLNPLVENAVKHGLQTSRKPLEIKISAKVNETRLVLEVINSGTLNNNSDRNGDGIGLKNVRERLRTLFGDNAVFELDQDGSFVKARIEISDETQSDHS